MHFLTKQQSEKLFTELKKDFPLHTSPQWCERRNPYDRVAMNRKWFREVLITPLELLGNLEMDLVARDILVKSIELAGGAASFVLSHSQKTYHDLDIIFNVALKPGDNEYAAFNRIQSSVKSALEKSANFYSRNVDVPAEAFFATMKKIHSTDPRGDLWSIFSLHNDKGQNFDLKFICRQSIQYQFSVDSFRILLTPLNELENEVYKNNFPALNATTARTISSAARTTTVTATEQSIATGRTATSRTATTKNAVYTAHGTVNVGRKNVPDHFEQEVKGHNNGVPSLNFSSNVTKESDIYPTQHQRSHKLEEKHDEVNIKLDSRINCDGMYTRRTSETRIHVFSLHPDGLEKAMNDLDRNVVIDDPYKIRGGGLLKYAKLLYDGYMPVTPDVEYKMVRQFLNNYGVIKATREKNKNSIIFQIDSYAKSRFIASPNDGEFFLTNLHRIVKTASEYVPDDSDFLMLMRILESKLWKEHHRECSFVAMLLKARNNRRFRRAPARFSRKAKTYSRRW